MSSSQLSGNVTYKVGGEWRTKLTKKMERILSKGVTTFIKQTLL